MTEEKYPDKNDVKDFRCNDENCNDGEKCSDNENKGLKYNNLSIVYFQIFTLEFGKQKNNRKEDRRNGNTNVSTSICKPTADDIEKGGFEPVKEPIDKLIFSYNNKTKPVERYKFKEFSFKAKFDEPYEVEINGKVMVEMSLFFNKTVSLTYTIIIDRNKDKTDENKIALLSTDHIIDLISLAVPSEDWGFGGHDEDDKDDKDSENDYADDAEDDEEIELDSEVGEIIISDLCLSENGDWCEPFTISNKTDEQDDKDSFLKKKTLMKIFDRYKKRVMKICGDERCADGKTPDSEDVVVSNYVYVDIWESVQHCGGLFDKYKGYDRTKIVSHIAECHKKELIGIMSMYPGEWPYRDAEAFKDVCGDNIAIDTDDLVLVNQNICVAFGTYGLAEKGKKSKWAKHLRKIRKRYYVSWPEYILVLEMLLAQKHMIEYTSEMLLDSILLMEKNENLEKKIERNAEVFLDTTKLLAQLDAVKYSKFISHKMMYDRTNIRLRIEESRIKLEELRHKVEESLRNVKDTQALKHSRFLSFLLAGIAVASLFGFLFMDLHFPILEYYIRYGTLDAHNLAIVLVLVLALIGVAGFGYFGYLMIRFLRSNFKKK